MPDHPPPESDRAESNRSEEHAIIQRSAYAFSGPLPPPDVIKKYDMVVPGAADRIIQLAEKQSTHRQAIETKIVDADIRQSNFGVIFGFILGLVGLIGGAFLVYHDKVVTGSVFFGATLVALVSVFVYGSRKGDRSREDEQSLDDDSH